MRRRSEQRRLAPAAAAAADGKRKTAGFIERDRLHDTVEVSDPSGRRHLGEFNPLDGRQVSAPDPTRSAFPPYALGTVSACVLFDVWDLLFGPPGRRIYSMGKDQIVGSVKIIKGSIKEIIGKATGVPNWRLKAEPTRSRAKSRMPLAISRTP